MCRDIWYKYGKGRFVCKLDAYECLIRSEVKGNSRARPLLAPLVPPPETAATMSTSSSFFPTQSTGSSLRNAYIFGRGYLGVYNSVSLNLSILHLEMSLTAPRSLKFNIASNLSSYFYPLIEVLQEPCILFQNRYKKFRN